MCFGDYNDTNVYNEGKTIVLSWVGASLDKM